MKAFLIDKESRTYFRQIHWRQSSRLLIALGFVLALATLLRVIGLGNDSLWNNEILSFQRASQPTLGESYAFLRDGTHPPLYALGVLRPWFLIRDNEFFQRLPSAVFGILTVALTFRLGSQAFGTKVGLAGAVLLTLSPLHPYNSREGRMYALFALLTTLCVFLLIKAVRENPIDTGSHMPCLEPQIPAKERLFRCDASMSPSCWRGRLGARFAGIQCIL